MFERFTDRARRVIVLAQEEARTLQHNYIGTEHLLLGLIREGEGVAAKALASKGVSLDDTRKQVEEMIGKGNASPNGHIPFTPHARQVLELSLREALQLGHSYIGTEHILLGLIHEGEGVGTQVLIKMDVNLGELRSATIDLIRGNSGGSQGEGKGDLANAGGVQDRRNQSGSAILDQFGRNLTAEAASGKLDPVIGRSSEIERVMVVLSRRTKNNPVLIGEPGVGKTAVVEGLEDIAPILALLSARLQQRESRYAVLFDLLLKLANTAIDSDKVAEKIADEARDDTPQALDAVWEEEQVKFFAEKGCGDSAITAHQRRFAGAVAPQYLNITTGGQH